MIKITNDTNKINIQIDFNNKKKKIQKPSKEMLKILQETEDIINGKKEPKGYHDVHKMFKEILKQN